MKILHRLFLALSFISPLLASQVGHVDTVIVGAGLAGLRAGMVLNEANRNFKIYEARSRIGGRTYSEELLPGVPVNMGGTFIDTDHRAILSLCKSLNVDYIPIYNERINRLFYFEDRLWSEAGLLAKASRLHKKMLSTRNMAYQIASKEAAYGMLSLEQCLNHWGASDLLHAVVRQLFATEDGFEPEQISCMTLLNEVLDNSLTLTNAFHSSIGDEKYMIKGGMNVLTDRMAENFRGHIQLDHELVGVQEHMNQWKLIFNTPEGNKIVFTNKLILTLPLNLYAHLELASSSLEFLLKPLKEVSLGYNDKVFLIFDRQFWDTSKGWLHIISSDYEFRGPPVGLEYPFIMAYRGGNLAKSAITTQQLLRMLQTLSNILGPEVYANFREAKDGILWAEEPFSQGAYTGVSAPGIWLNQSENRPICHKGVCVAGEAFASEDSRGFMNGAIETGFQAAEFVKTAAH